MIHKNLFIFLVSVVLLLPSSLVLANSTPIKGFQPLVNFGDNPGELTASYSIPSDKSRGLVVFLHGCTQNAELVAEQSGLLALTTQHQLTLLLPQQHQRNNIKSCFNWFAPEDTLPDKGETASLINMITTLKQQYGLDNIYIAGLSAGGAMVSVLISHYPELFTGAAIIAGIPYPCADNIIKAIACMRNGPADDLTQHQLAEAKIQRLPRILVLTGDQDNVVNPLNSIQLAKQWAHYHQAITSKTFNHEHWSETIWKNKQQNEVVTLVQLSGLGHGMSVNSAEAMGGKPAPFLLDSSFSSAKKILQFWGF
jgi:poly(hydroxyalkanoate) depolymerase family esterase